MKLQSVFLIAVFAMFPCAFFAVADEGEAKLVSISPSLDNGDVNADGHRNVTDVIALVNHLFVGGPPPVAAECQIPATGGTPPRTVSTLVANGDIDGSERIDITDVIRLVNWLYSGGPDPVSLDCNWYDLP